jgi:hypothetical protein
VAKSSILFSKNTLDSTIRSIKGIIPFQDTSLSSSYLGLPFFIGKSKKIEGWRAKTLSQAGRTVLIKATASAIPSYAMSTFLLLDSLCSTLDRHFKNFWWGFPNGKSKNLSFKSWRSICIPRDQVGIGIRNMKSTNLALLTKLGWMFIN